MLFTGTATGRPDSGAVPSASGLAADSLAGLARLTLAFGLLLAAASAGLVLIVGAAQRRRSLVALAVIGASVRQRAGLRQAPPAVTIASVTKPARSPASRP